jgi:hypothetical protein
MELFKYLTVCLSLTLLASSAIGFEVVEPTIDGNYECECDSGRCGESVRKIMPERPLGVGIETKLDPRSGVEFYLVSLQNFRTPGNLRTEFLLDAVRSFKNPVQRTLSDYSQLRNDNLYWGYTTGTLEFDFRKTGSADQLIVTGDFRFTQSVKVTNDPHSPKSGARGYYFETLEQQLPKMKLNCRKL